jgi:hypothetical protein
LTEREYRRAKEDFQSLKALRHELPNEPIAEAQPEQNETTCDPLPTDPFPPHDQFPMPPPAPPAPRSVSAMSSQSIRTPVPLDMLHGM